MLRCAADLGVMRLWPAERTEGLGAERGRPRRFFNVWGRLVRCCIPKRLRFDEEVGDDEHTERGRALLRQEQARPRAPQALRSLLPSRQAGLIGASQTARCHGAACAVRGVRTGSRAAAQEARARGQPIGECLGLWGGPEAAGGAAEVRARNLAARDAGAPASSGGRCAPARRSVRGAVLAQGGSWQHRGSRATANVGGTSDLCYQGREGVAFATPLWRVGCDSVSLSPVTLQAGGHCSQARARQAARQGPPRRRDAIAWQQLPARAAEPGQHNGHAQHAMYTHDAHCCCRAVANLGKFCCRARRAAQQEPARALDAPRRSFTGTRPSGLGRASPAAPSAPLLPCGAPAPALTHGLLRNVYDATGSSSPGALPALCTLILPYHFQPACRC